MSISFRYKSYRNVNKRKLYITFLELKKTWSEALEKTAEPDRTCVIVKIQKHFWPKFKQWQNGIRKYTDKLLIRSAECRNRILTLQLERQYYLHVYHLQLNEANREIIMNYHRREANRENPLEYFWNLGWNVFTFLYTKTKIKWRI